MEEPTYIAFIDESGCDGDKFGKGSSEFLVLSATVGVEAMRPEIDIRCNILRSMANKTADWTIPKFEKANQSIRWAACDLFADLPFYATHVIIHKPSIQDDKLRTDRNRLYRFASKFLIERISWICRALHSPSAPGSFCDIVFSQDKSRSYDSFKAYIKHLSENRTVFANGIDWKHIRPDLIRDVPFRKDIGLLLADYHASALGLAIEKKTFGMHDDRFARKLGQPILTSRRSAFGYGYKFWPVQSERLYRSDPRFTWMHSI